MRSNVSYLMVAMIGAGLAACGGGKTGNPNGMQPAGDDGGVSMPDAGQGDDVGDAAAEAGPVDHGAPSSTYPAFPVNFARIQDQGGSVLKNPVIVAITWTADPSQAAFETFADSIGGTTYWKTTTSEYGVGPAVSGATNHVHVDTAPPKQLQDSDLQTMVTTNAGNGWPAATQETVYAFFLPPGTSLLVQGLGGGGQDACTSGVGGYHQGVTAGGVQTSYAVVPSCNRGGTPAAQETTMSMSHELIEAATDPDPNSPAYVGFDGDHFSFDYFQMLQAETGDACEFFRTSFYEEKETSPAFDEWVQRTWSNASGAAAHDPCVPPAQSVYFNVTPLDLATVPLHIPPQAAQFIPGNLPSTTKGIGAGVGKPVTFQVGFYSDGPTNGPWKLSASAGNPVLGSMSIIDQLNMSSVTVSVDKTSGQNGEKAYVTVNVASHGALFQGEIITLTSTLGGVSHYMPVWIGAM